MLKSIVKNMEHKMKNLIYINEIPKQFKDCSEYIKERIEYFYNYFDFNCKIKIKFVEFAKINVFEITDCMLENLSTKEHELIFTNQVLETINHDGGKYFSITIYHEFEHINDYIKMMQTNHFNFNLCLKHQKNFERQYISVGYAFWTEVNSYFKTLEFAKDNEIEYEKITFGSLVSNYKKTIESNKEYYCKKDLTKKEVEKYEKMVDSFVYLCSKYLASSYASHSRIPHARIERNKDYERVYLILAELHQKIMKQIDCDYGFNSNKNLFEIGKFICEKIRWKIFKLGLVIEKKKVCSFY